MPDRQGTFPPQRVAERGLPVHGDQSPHLREGSRVAWYLGWVGAAVLIAVLARPMVFGRTFIGWDWYPHQWFIWHQAESLKATGLPTLVLHGYDAVFVPHFAFYGGTLNAVAGALTLLTGDANSRDGGLVHLRVRGLLRRLVLAGASVWARCLVGARAGRAVHHRPVLPRDDLRERQPA